METEGLIMKLVFLNGFKLYVNWIFSDIAIFFPKIFSTSLFACEILSIFQNEIYKIRHVPKLN